MRFFSGRRFHFRPVPFIATVLVMAIGLSLGQWQIRRADQKRAIEVKLMQRAAAPALQADTLLGASAEPEALEFRMLQLHGSFIAGWPLYLDNRPLQNRAGLYVLMPFQLAGRSEVVLVQRGWLPRDPIDRARLPVLHTPDGIIDIAGRARRAPGHVLQLGQAPALKPGAIVQNLDPAELAQSSGLALQPFLLEQTSATPDGLVRDWPQPSSGIERHLGYAFQWYALAAMAGVFFVVTGFKRGKSANA